MICSICGGGVYWCGPLVALTHTQCLSCGAINSQEVDDSRTAETCDRCGAIVPHGDRLCAGCDDKEFEGRQAIHEWREENRRGEDYEP